MIITIPGRPIPAVRMTGRGKYVKSNAQRYLVYKTEIGLRTRNVIKTPSDKKIMVSVVVYLHGKTTEMGNDGDVDNYLKSALDGLNKIAFTDDRQVINAMVRKVPCGKDEERMEIVIKEIVLKGINEMNLKRHAINLNEPWKTRCGLTKAYITNMYGGEVTCKRCLHHIKWEKENKGA